ncbi:hypothetical protein [Streptomyces sp. NPDC057382]|uniref:hypothetical protein n=1 Tax=unclassified Streptomyces TaxID=2593676 RepID=UPI003643D171
MDLNVWAIAVGGGILVVVLVVFAVVVLGWKALGCANKKDVPIVTDTIMRVLREGKQSVHRQVVPERVQQPLNEEGQR